MGMIYLRFGAPAERHPAAVVIGAAVGIGLIGTGLYFLFTTSYLPHWPIVGGAVAYLLVAYIVKPEADTSELGWLGGLIDNPFRFNDDVNRGLLSISILLFPGRVIMESIVGLLLLPFRSASPGEAVLGEELLVHREEPPRFPPA